MKREFLDYIEDIIEAINSVMKFTEGMEYEEFIKDDKLQRLLYENLKLLEKR